MGRVLLAQRVGEPNPYGSNFACSRSSFRASRFTCRPSGAKCVTICGVVSIVGARFPRPTGWGTQPLRIQLRLLTFQFSYLPVHLSPLWGFRYLVYRACYKHVAPLGLNAGQFAARYPSWGEFTSPSGLGNPTPTGSTVCDNTTLRSSGARGLDVSRCYKHVAPLGLNASQLAARIPSWGGFSSPSGLGNPTPTDPTSRAHVPIFVPPGSHVAPLGLNAAQFAARYPSWGEFSSPSGLGNPTPTDPTSLAHVPIFVPPCSPVAPLGLNAAMSHLTYHAS